MISVIIPTRNAARYMPALLDMLSKQVISHDLLEKLNITQEHGKIFEYIFVDSESEDDTVSMVEAFSDKYARASSDLSLDTMSDDIGHANQAACFEVEVLSVKPSDFDHGGTRNMAWRQAKGDIICFLTQDAIPADEYYFAKLLAGLNDTDVVMISGRQIPKGDANPVERLTREFNYPKNSFTRTLADIESMGIKAYFFSDACAVYRRSFLEEMGGFEEPILTNEDMLMASSALAAGYKVGYAADARVYHSHNFSLNYQYRRNFDVSVFLTQHADVIKSGGTTKEGIRMVLFTEKELLKHFHFISMFRCVFESAAKFLGNRAGRNYEQMSHEVILKKTSNPAYWKKMWGE